MSVHAAHQPSLSRVQCSISRMECLASQVPPCSRVVRGRGRGRVRVVRWEVGGVSVGRVAHVLDLLRHSVGAEIDPDAVVLALLELLGVRAEEARQLLTVVDAHLVRGRVEGSGLG